MKKLLMFIILLSISVGASSGLPLSSIGTNGPVSIESSFSIESSNAPSLFHDDEGSTGRFEALSISPSKTVYSDKYIKYSDNFDADKWRNDSHSSYGVGWRADWSNIYPMLLDQQTYVRYNFNFSGQYESVFLDLTGNRRDLRNNLTVYISSDNSKYIKLIEFDDVVDSIKKANITDYIKNNQTWIEFRFYQSSKSSGIPRILDFSLEAIYNDVAIIPSIYVPLKNTFYSDNFDTDKWRNDSHSSYGVGWRADWSSIYPALLDQHTYLRYNFNFEGYYENILLELTGNRRDLRNNLTVYISPDNSSYTELIEFDSPVDSIKTANITDYIKNNQTWIEFRFYQSSKSDGIPRILDFSINTSQYIWKSTDAQIGGNIEIPTRTIDRDHFYYFAPHYPSPAGATAARIAYFDTKYSAIEVNSQYAVLGSFVKNDADIKLTYGTPLSLGSGFVLEIEDMGAKDNQAVVVLKKDGKLLDRGVYEAGKTYSFKTEVAGVNNTEVFKADVISVFKSNFNSRVELKHVYLLDTSATIIKQGDSFGDFEVDLTDFDKDKDTDITIKLKNDKTFTLDRNTTIGLFGGLSIKVADSDDLRFAVIKKFTKSGKYQQTGPYGTYGQVYDIDSFDAPGLFTYDIDKNDTLESLSISSSMNRINDIRYSTFNKNNRIAYLGKTYNAIPSSGKIALNEILKDDDERTTVRYGSPLYIEGFTLELLDIGERTALLQLKKGDTVLEKSSVDSGDSFVYKRSIEGKEIEIFNATVKSVFRSDFAGLVELENLLLLNDTTLIVKDGDTVGGDYETDVADINGDGAMDIMVKLKSGKSFGVSKDSTTGILGGYMSLKAYETTSLPVRSVTINMNVNSVSSANPAGTAQPAQSTATEPTSSQAASAVDTSAVEMPEAEETPANSASSENLRAPPVNVVYILGSAGAIILSVLAYRWFRFRKLI